MPKINPELAKSDFEIKKESSAALPKTKELAETAVKKYDPAEKKQYLSQYRQSAEKLLQAIKKIPDDELAPELREAKTWLPGFRYRLSEDKQELQKKIDSVKDSQASQLGVSLSELAWSIKKEDDILHRELLGYALEKLENIAEKQLEINIEEIKKKESLYPEEAEKKLKEQERQELTEETGEQAEKSKFSWRKIKNFLKDSANLVKDALSKFLVSPLVLVAGTVASFIKVSNSLVQFILPKLMRSSLWKRSSQQRSFKQRPGYKPPYFSESAPVVVRVKEEVKRNFTQSLGISQSMPTCFDTINPYVSTQEFENYNPQSDAFEVKSQERNCKPYKIGKISEKEEQTVKDNFSRVETEIIEINPHLVADEQGMIRLPVPKSAEARAVPWKAELVSPRGSVALDLFYDEDNNLYANINGVPKRIRKANLKTSFLTERFSEQNHLRNKYFLQKVLFNQNKEYFQPQENLKIDERAAAADLPMREKLSTEMAKWSNLPNNSAKAEEVKDYILACFAYPKSSFSRFRIAMQKGRTDLQKILNAHEGNCYDANRVAYVLLQKLGVPCRLNNGFTILSNSNMGKDIEVSGIEELGRLDLNMEKLEEGATVGMEGEIDFKGGSSDKSGYFQMNMRASGGHSFLEYYDEQAEAWRVLDATPVQSYSELRSYEKSSAKNDAKERRNRKRLRRLERKHKLISAEEIKQRQQEIRKTINKCNRFWKHRKKEIGFYLPEKRGMDDFDFLPEPWLPNSRYLKTYRIWEKLQPVQEKAYQMAEQLIEEKMGSLQNAIEEKLRPLRRKNPAFQNLIASYGSELGISEFTPLAEAKHKLSARICRGLADTGLVSPFGNIFITYKSETEEYVFTRNYYVEDKDEVYFSEDQLLARFELSLKNWQDQAKHFVNSFIMRIEEMDLPSMGDYVEVLYDYVPKSESPGIYYPERDLAEKLYALWHQGRIHGKIKKDKNGRNALFLKDPETGKELILRQHENITGLSDKQKGQR